MTKKRLYVLLLLVTFEVSCSGGGQNYSLHTDITNFTKNHFDIKKLLPEGYKIIDIRIKNHLLLLKIQEPLNHSHFLGINLIDSSVSFNVKDPSKDYIGSSFDVEGDSLLCVSALNPRCVYKVSLKTNKFNILIIEDNKQSIPGQIALNKNQLFFYSDVYGISVIDLVSNQIKRFKACGISGTINPQTSSISFPINDTLNLLRGHVNKDSIILYAVDQKNHIRWERPILEYYNSFKIDFLSMASQFIVKSDTSLYSLDKNSGKERWRIRTGYSVKYLYSCNNGLLECCLLNSNNVYSGMDKVYNMKLRLIDKNDGGELWSFTFNTTSIPNLGICYNKVLLSSDTEFKVIDLQQGNEVERKSNISKMGSNYAFEMLCDFVTGDYYLHSYDDVLYW